MMSAQQLTSFPGKKTSAVVALAVVITTWALAGPTTAPASPWQADTLYEISTPAAILDTTFVDADHITIEEIIRRATSGERTKLAGHQTMTYNVTFHTIAEWKKKKRREIEDRVVRVYIDSLGNARRLYLDEQTVRYKKDGDDWVVDEEKEDADANVRVTTSDVNAFTDLPFFLKDTSEYRFELLDRRLQVDRVIFKIAFKPKSDFAPLPSGVVYIDTSVYRIIHEEYSFGTNPMPLFMKGIRRLSRQWAELPGGEWVATVIKGELDMRADPFGFIPDHISMGIVLSDYVFDEPYDEVLFGKIKREVPIITAAPTSNEPLVPVAPQGMLADLQRSDDEAYSQVLDTTDVAFVESVIAQHDSLGLAGFMKFQSASINNWHFGYSYSNQLSTFNRVEGLVAGIEGEVEYRRKVGVALMGQAAYATAPKRVRYYADLAVPIDTGAWDLRFDAIYHDRVEPFGSNRPLLSGIRAIVAGADDQNYMRRLGGSLDATLARNSSRWVKGGYEQIEDTTVKTDSDVSLFGTLGQPNPAIDEGTEHTVTAAFAWQFWQRYDFFLGQRTSGGSLGGDFRYNRSDVSFDLRQFVGRQEFHAKVWGVVTGDQTPTQWLADLGGLSTLRGYDQRVRVGTSSLALRLEYMVPYDIFRAARIPLLKKWSIQFVPWGDSGRVWQGGADGWISSLGFGFQKYIGPFGPASNLRLDFAFPVTEGFRGDTTVIFTFHYGIF